MAARTLYDKIWEAHTVTDAGDGLQGRGGRGVDVDEGSGGFLLHFFGRGLGSFLLRCRLGGQEGGESKQRD